MNKLIPLLYGLIFYIFSQLGYATPDSTQVAVWANEAIIATYTFNYKTYLKQQKDIAKYFTSDGWIAYSKALNASKLPETVKQNFYDVTAVATQPPKIITLDPTHWQAIMPILVVYQNPQYQQRQNLKVVIRFTTAAASQGVRGLSITSLQSTVTEPPCQCPNKESKDVTSPGVEKP
ncbi:type IV secretion system protein IcmL [Legionella antarctica]|uniref:Type IV secretion system protein IcmL n=1 Tax=Legionella antarctica TaxID=2708020 RepID=A0A6F8T1I0_9GAMM|nr:DotI/IcmL family type IV secretion protein [Legionella antarctica]BCA93872.1 type IV secretion system protein IcmL [Legionella antarctica]